MVYASTATQAQLSLLAQWLIRKTADAGSRRIAQVDALIATDIGAVRSENQDRIVSARFWNETGHPYTCTAVADGMGGMKAGEESAALTLASFLHVLKVALSDRLAPEEALIRAAYSANRAVYTKHGGKGGATLSALLITRDEKTYWLNVGDSRVYAGSAGKLSQLSTDDTLAGQFSRPVDYEHNDSHLIQFIGIGDALEPHVGAINTGIHDWYLLTSDGVHNMPAAVDLMSRLVNQAADSGAAAKRLVDVARWCGGRDNASAAVIFTRADRGKDRPYQAGCMEVWDPFGDLQVVVEQIATKEGSETKPTRPVKPRPARRGPVAAKGARGKAELAGINASQPIPKINVSEPELGNPTSSETAPTPAKSLQLQVDFPLKSEEE